METETRSTAYADQLAAFDAAQAALAGTSTTDLLRSAYALTHRMDGLDRQSRRLDGSSLSDDVVRARRDLRQQRDMIDAEILRRTEGTTLRVTR